MNNNTPRDLQAAQHAFPVEQAEVRADPFTGANHAELPGVPANEQYMIGNELNRTEQGQFNQGVSMGGLDAASLYPVSDPFADQHPAYDQYQGFDSMRGLYSGTAVPAELANQSMYLIGGRAVSAEEYYGQRPANTDE